MNFLHMILHMYILTIYCSNIFLSHHYHEFTIVSWSTDIFVPSFPSARSITTKLIVRRFTFIGFASFQYLLSTHIHRHCVSFLRMMCHTYFWGIFIELLVFRSWNFLISWFNTQTQVIYSVENVYMHPHKKTVNGF
jgi:hypothetical protein